MTFGSLFAGIGGFDLGFERAGMRCVWQVERDKQCLDLLANKWPESIRVNDVIKARFLLEPKYARRMDAITLVRPDVICGGFPCQDLSIAGKRRGLAGRRSGLFWTIRRIIALLKPPWIVLENVPGLLSSNKGWDMGAVIGALVDGGYGIAWRVLDSQFFGLAQRRKRVFIVGHLGDVRRAGQILFDGESMSRNHPPSRETREEVAGSIGARTGNSRGVQDAVSNHMIAKAYRTSGNNGVMDQGDRTAALNCGTDPNQNIVSITIAGSMVVRRLMPIECERLQGFPDNWTEGFSDSVRYRMLGNAVSVPVAEWIGKRIMEACQ